MDGPYDEAFLEKIQKCPAEDDGSVEYAVAKVSEIPLRRSLKNFLDLGFIVCKNVKGNPSDCKVASLSV